MNGGRTIWRTKMRNALKEEALLHVLARWWYRSVHVYNRLLHHCSFSLLCVPSTHRRTS
jgi:hypothetical protein